MTFDLFCIIWLIVAVVILAGGLVWAGFNSNKQTNIYYHNDEEKYVVIVVVIAITWPLILILLPLAGLFCLGKYLGASKCKMKIQEKQV